MKITISVTSEQAEELDRLQAEGKLAELGLAPLIATPKLPLWKRISYGRIASFASIACSLSMMFPVYAPPFYFVGMALSVVGVVLAGDRKRNLLLPIIAFLLNAGALLAWPKAVGVYEKNGGYEFRLGDRSPPVQKPVNEAPTAEGPKVVIINIASIRKQMDAIPYKKGDVLRITADGKIVVERPITAEEAASPDDIIVEYGPDTGKHFLAVAINQNQIFSGEIDASAAVAPTVLFKDRNLSVTATAKIK